MRVCVCEMSFNIKGNAIFVEYVFLLKSFGEKIACVRKVSPPALYYRTQFLCLFAAYLCSAQTKKSLDCDKSASHLVTHRVHGQHQPNRISV